MQLQGSIALCMGIVLVVSCHQPGEGIGKSSSNSDRRPPEEGASAVQLRGDRFSSLFPPDKAAAGGEVNSKRQRARRIGFRAGKYAQQGVKPVSYTWRYGDRSMPLQGVAVGGAGAEFTFEAPTGEGKHLTRRGRTG